MDVADLVNEASAFFDEIHKKELLKSINSGEKAFQVSFKELIGFNADLAEELLENPEETIKAFSVAIGQIDVPKSKKKKSEGIKVRFTDLPKNCDMMLRDIRARHLNKLITFDALIKRRSDVRPIIHSIRFECPTCGTVMSLLQLNKTKTQPSRCSCGRKGKFKELSKELVDAQSLVLEESPDDIEDGSHPHRMKALMKHDLTSTESQQIIRPGSKVRFIGIVSEKTMMDKRGKSLAKLDIIIRVNNFVPLEEDYSRITIESGQEEKIIGYSKDEDIYTKLRESLAPNIYGHDEIKDAIVLQLFGGCREELEDGSFKRGDIHIMLVGDAGVSKSVLLKTVKNLAPKGRYVSGKGASGVGLTAAVVKDDVIGGFSLEAGALVLSNNGLCCTTEDAEFILENGKKKTFKELFDGEEKSIIHPKFKVMALNEETLKIESFKIKQALKIKTDKKLYKIETRTGRTITLTEDNEMLTCNDSKINWKEIGEMKKGEFIAVPKRIHLEREDNHSKEFAYLCGLIASDGHINYNKRHAQTFFYNTNLHLIEDCERIMKSMGLNIGRYITKKGKKSSIRGRTIEQKKDCHIVYACTKGFAEKLMEFGIPSGNKSTKYPLSDKIYEYSNRTISLFLRGYFDGNGSFRSNPTEAVFITGMEKNARLFQELLTRLGIVSSIKKMPHTWHCSIRGLNYCEKFKAIIGTNHPKKKEKMLRVISKAISKGKGVKDRLDVIPNHNGFFKELRKRYWGKLKTQRYKHFWNYSKKGVSPSVHKLKKLNRGLGDKTLKRFCESHILWDKIVSIEKHHKEYVYDFTMEGTNNFVANNIIMHNCIDEFDKMTEEDRSAMHEALSSQTVTVAKANIQATLLTRTSVLAAANPKDGRFDPYKEITMQIDMPPTLLNRFDLIFIMRDIRDESKDSLLAEFMLGITKMLKSKINKEMFRKYIAYAKKNFKPKPTPAALKRIHDFYVELRGKSQGDDTGRTIPISPRQLDAIVRLTKASARIRLSNIATVADADRAIGLMMYCLQTAGWDASTGRIDVDRINIGVGVSRRDRMNLIYDTITELQQKGEEKVSFEKIFVVAEAQGMNPREVEDNIEILKKHGQIYEPESGHYRRL